MRQVQRLGIWLAVIGAFIGFAVVAVLIWIFVAVINPFGD
jgi:multisubunit Na+/H+ antiporter MnhG subunit